MIDTIQVGYQVFSKEGGEEFGAVRAVERGHRAQIVVYVENAGDFVVLPNAIKAVHDQKVILDLTAVDVGLRNAVAHAHDREQRGK
ncbi:MAG TPA: hypothetical protein VGP07_19720 [Polyangia bacterium]|jgi:hypothetical protein